MGGRISGLRDEWNSRAQRLGKTRRSVLFKRFPSWLNNRIHRKHRDFVLNNMPPHTSSVLDVGCGYGRIARVIRERYPTIPISGIDLSEEFCAAYREEFGTCFNVPIQEFQATKQYDAIIMVTVLMYLDRGELVSVIEKYWSMLSPDGVMICIEPAIEFLQLWRRLTGTSSASPTGGSVNHFQKDSLNSLFSGLNCADVRGEVSVNLLPGIDFSSLHHGVAVVKKN